MTHFDNSKIFHEGVYADVTLTVPASTTLKVGTVLGRNSSGKLVPFSTANNVAGTSTTEAFKTSPLYILAQNVINDATSSADFDLVKVFDSGVVDKSGLIFIKEADASDVTVLDGLKTNNFRLINVEEQAGTSSLGR